MYLHSGQNFPYRHLELTGNVLLLEEGFNFDGYNQRENRPPQR